MGAVALAHVEQHVGRHRPPAPGRVGADAFPGQRHHLLDRGRVVVADHPGQADQSRQQRLQHGPSGQIVAGGQHGQGAEDRGGSLVVASTLQQRIQIRHPAQGGVGDRPLPQRPASAAGSGQSAPLGVQAHQGVGHGGPPRHMWALGASRPVFTPAFPPACLLLSPTGSWRQRRPPGVSPSATSGDQARCRQDPNPRDSRGPLAGAWHEGCAPPFTRAFTSPSPEQAPDA